MKSYWMITGAMGGLGSAFAVECAKRGFDLFLTDLYPEGIEFARSLANTFQVDVQYRTCNLASLPSRTDFYEELRNGGYSFWGLANVAGIDFEGAFLDRRREQILRIMQLNVESTVDTSYTILKLRDPEQKFRLINVCSLAAYFPMPYKAIYAATKRFLLDFSMALSEEIQPFGSVTALCPAGLPTTPETMRAIFAQGFWGQITTMDTRYVARRAVGMALKGKPVYVPGFLNRIIQSLGNLVPRSLAVHYAGKRWQIAQNEQMAWQQLKLPVAKPELHMDVERLNSEVQV